MEFGKQPPRKEFAPIALASSMYWPRRTSKRDAATATWTQGERVRHHRADAWPILLLLTPTPTELHPEADFKRQEDDRHSAQEDATERDEIEGSIVSHTIPDPSSRGKSFGQHLNGMAPPVAEIRR
jgi:hypothetical protein